MERIANLSIKEDMTGRTVVIAYLKGMRPPSAVARDKAKSRPPRKFKYTNKNGELVQLVVSGANLGNRFVHGTVIKSASDILTTGQLLMGESKPHGIYGYSETQMEASPAIQKKANFYDLGAKVSFEGYGAQVHIDKLHRDFLHDVVPENMVGRFKDHRVIVNPFGAQAVEIRFDAVMLCRYLDEALDYCGYGKAYHETLLELKKKYDKERDGVVRAKRSKCG